jgi:L-arabonate dehydrase
MGFTLPGAASIPAPDSRHAAMATLTGKRAVEMVWEDLKPRDILHADAVHNAVTAVLAIGGSTNAIVHLIALARRAGVLLDLDLFDALARKTPLLANIRPSGKYLMEDFYYAGGLPVVMRELGKAGLLHKNALTVSGDSIWNNVKAAKNWNPKVIFPIEKPFKKQGGIAVLRGNLVPKGAVIKPSAATPKLMRHRGRAVVFESIEDYRKRIDDPKLKIDETCVMVLKGCGPKGYPGFPEVGNFSLPAKILKKGITDMVRISDARMSGTAYGTVVLHSAPEAAAGGPLALVQDGDMIEIDVPKRKLHLDVSDAELERRHKKWKAPKPMADRGYVKLYIDHVNQADEGADLDILVGGSGTPLLRESH